MIPLADISAFVSAASAHPHTAIFQHSESRHTYIHLRHKAFPAAEYKFAISDLALAEAVDWRALVKSHLDMAAADLANVTSNTPLRDWAP